MHAVLQIFSLIEGIDYVPHITSYNSILNGLLKLDCINLCWEIYTEMGKRQIPPNTFTFNIM